MPWIERRNGYRLWIGGPVPPGAAAVTLGSLIIVRRRAARDPELLAHELVHVEQWRRYGLVGFAWRYLVAYLRWRLEGYPHWAAYRRVPFEVEAVWLARQGRRARPDPGRRVVAVTGPQQGGDSAQGSP